MSSHGGSIYGKVVGIFGRGGGGRESSMEQIVSRTHLTEKMLENSKTWPNYSSLDEGSVNCQSGLKRALAVT